MIYELTILTPEKSNAEDLANIKSTVEKWGAIHTTEDDGVKRLAYPITLQGITHEVARYLFYTVELNEGDPQKLSGELSRKDEVLRFLLVKQDPKYSKR